MGIMRKVLPVVLSLLLLVLAVAAASRPAESHAAKTFEITARQWNYTINPSPFVVDQGDTVTLRLTVPGDDGSDTGHGFAMERYLEDGIIVARGRTQQITFTATTPGTFLFLCTNASCGLPGHNSMNGIFTVNAAVPEPDVASISPSSGPASGGTAVTINGSNFTSGATVKFGAIAATSVTVNGNTSITAVAPPSGPGKVTITITNPDGKTSVFDGYTYTGPAPPRRRTARS